VLGEDALTESNNTDDISPEDAQPIRLQLVQVAASNALQYAALAIGMAVLLGALLNESGSPGDKNPLWLVEGVLLSGIVHTVLNSAYYGRFGSLVGGMIPSAGLERVVDPDLPQTSAKNDYLSRLSYRYSIETRRRWYIAPFSGVFSRKLFWFVVLGLASGWFVLTPSNGLRVILAVAGVTIIGGKCWRCRNSSHRRYASAPFASH
jgi:hypothetical protein